MRVVEVRISNIRSIEELTLKPGVLTILEGNNAVGKTSILMAIKCVFEGGHTPDLIRTGAKRAEVAMVLDTGTTIRRVITEKSSKLEVSTTDGAPVPEGPQHFVESLASGFAFDPLAFVEAKPKERLAYLQRALNLLFGPDEVRAAAGLTVPAPVDLDGLDRIREAIYKDRTKENTLTKQARATVERLSAALAEDDAVDWKKEAAELQQARDMHLADMNRQAKEVADRAAVTRATLQAEYEQMVKELDTRRQAQLKAIAALESEQLEAISTANWQQTQLLTAKLATAQERARKAASNEAFKQEVAHAAGEALTHESTAKAMTSKLEAIDRMKQKKLADLPISGVEIRDGGFYCDGLPFDSLNTAAQYLKAFEVGALQPGNLGLMIADKLESLGPANWQLFQDAAVQSGFQIFATRVTEGPLAISMVG